MKPRIYTYKIIFPNQGWWYWGVHKERKYGEEYNGSPCTHREKWDNFYFEKQILEFFETWGEARKVEERLIKPDLNNPMCLNEGCNLKISLESTRKGGRTQGKVNAESGRMSEMGKVGGKLGSKEGKREGGRNGCRVAKSKSGRKNMLKLQRQRWKCLVTLRVMDPGNLTKHQRRNGIDTSLRERVQ